MNKKPTSTLFWAKHLGLALAVIIVAGIVIHLQMNMTSAPTPVDAPEDPAEYERTVEAKWQAAFEAAL